MKTVNLLAKGCPGGLTVLTVAQTSPEFVGGQAVLWRLPPKAAVRQIIRFMIGNSLNKGEASVNSHIAFRPYAQNALVFHRL